LTINLSVGDIGELLRLTQEGRAMIIKEVKSLLYYLIIFGLILVVGGCPYDNDDDNDDDVICSGKPSECFEPLYGWDFEGTVIDEPYLFDVTVVKLDDGRYRLYGEDSQYSRTHVEHAIVSYISDDGLQFQKEDGNRLTGNLYMPFIVKLSDGRFRLYYTETGNKNSIRSAISEDGLTVTLEEGDRLTSNGSSYESEGVGRQKILQLSDGSYRMYYIGYGESGHERILSAVSEDGLDWTREEGIIIDPSDLCPPATGIGNSVPFMTSDGVYHLYVVTGTCKENYKDEKWGIFDATSPDGLTFTLSEEPIIDPTDPAVVPQDPAVVMTDNGLRMYCGLYDGPEVIEESAIYSLINETIT
jgi:hypothetical protein